MNAFSITCRPLLVRLTSDAAGAHCPGLVAISAPFQEDQSGGRRRQVTRISGYVRRRHLSRTVEALFNRELTAGLKTFVADIEVRSSSTRECGSGPAESAILALAQAVELVQKTTQLFLYSLQLFHLLEARVVPVQRDELVGGFSALDRDLGEADADVADE